MVEIPVKREIPDQKGEMFQGGMFFTKGKIHPPCSSGSPGFSGAKGGPAPSPGIFRWLTGASSPHREFSGGTGQHP